MGRIFAVSTKTTYGGPPRHRRAVDFRKGTCQVNEPEVDREEEAPRKAWTTPQLQTLPLDQTQGFTGTSSDITSTS